MAINSMNAYISAFLEPGDELERGGVVEYGRAAVRLVGGVELTGDAEDLANFGQTLVDHYRRVSYALVVGNMATGHTFYGPTSPGEPAAEDKIVDLVDATWAWVDLSPISQTVTPGKPKTPALLTQFWQHLAERKARQDEADRLCDAANANGNPEDGEDRARAAADNARCAALEVAEQIIRRAFGNAPRAAAGPATE